MPCNHPNSELRLRTLSNGATAIHRQCMICGEPTSTAIKKNTLTAEQLADLPPFDDELREAYRKMEVQHNREQAAARRAEWDADSPERKAEYAEYLKSPEWRAKREAVLERDRYLCQGCRGARATDVHHLTYKHRGHELLFELTSVCRPCHDILHGIEP